MRVVCLAGGVGGARLVQGLARVEELDLSVIVNTGDDFDHWGLRICPDLDTVMYTLAGLAHAERGWGLEEESFATFDAMRGLGGEDWFALGDRDLATHLRRTSALQAGLPLSEVTRLLCEALGVRTRVLPMSDALCPTLVNGGDFQTWLVRQRAPLVESLQTTPGAASPGVQMLLAEAELIVIAPSNPYVSIDPILGCIELPPGVPVVAVSPIVAGHAVKGPLGHMIPALTGREASAQAIWEHYTARGVALHGMLVQTGDVITGRNRATEIVMGGPADRERLARELLDLR